MANKDIIQELNDLSSSLGGITNQNIYSVPEGYFDDFADLVLAVVRSDADLIWLNSLPKTNPYQAPPGYFIGLEERMMNLIRGHADYQTSQEELESISPLLNSLNKRPVYAVPEGYFGNFKITTTEQKESKSKVIPLTSHKWLRYAAAAVVFIAVAMASILVYNNNHKDPAGITLARFEKDVKTIDDVNKTDSLIDFMDAGLNQKELASNHAAIKTDDVQQLLQDVPTDELKDFNDQSKDIEDVMMVN